MSTTKNVTIKQFNGTDYDIINPKTTASNLTDIAVTSADNDKVLKVVGGVWAKADAPAGMVGVSATLTSSGWSQQSSGAYAQSVSITGKNLTSASNVIVDCALSMSDLDADVEVLTAWGCVNNAVAGTDTLTFYCYATAPTVAIPISVVISG